MIIISIGSIVTGFLIWLILKSVIEVLAERFGNWADKQSQKELDKKTDISINTTKLSEEVLPTKESKLLEELRREEIKRKWRESRKA